MGHPWQHRPATSAPSVCDSTWYSRDDGHGDVVLPGGITRCAADGVSIEAIPIPMGYWIPISTANSSLQPDGRSSRRWRPTCRGHAGPNRRPLGMTRCYFCPRTTARLFVFHTLGFLGTVSSSLRMLSRIAAVADTRRR
jgi:hypothetical protein